MTFNKSTDWTKPLQKIVQGINATPKISLGNLPPNSIQSALDEPRVRNAQKDLAAGMSLKQRQRYFPKIDSYNDMVAFAEKYHKEQPHDLRPGVFVYLDYIPSAMTKATMSEKRGKVYIIKAVKYDKSVRLYKLMDLNFHVRC